MDFGCRSRDVRPGDRLRQRRLEQREHDPPRDLTRPACSPLCADHFTIGRVGDSVPDRDRACSRHRRGGRKAGLRALQGPRPTRPAAPVDPEPAAHAPRARARGGAVGPDQLGDGLAETPQLAAPRSSVQGSTEAAYSSKPVACSIKSRSSSPGPGSPAPACWLGRCRCRRRSRARSRRRGPSPSAGGRTRRSGPPPTAWSTCGRRSEGSPGRWSPTGRRRRCPPPPGRSSSGRRPRRPSPDRRRWARVSCDCRNRCAGAARSSASFPGRHSQHSSVAHQRPGEPAVAPFARRPCHGVAPYPAKIPRHLATRRLGPHPADDGRREQRYAG